MVLVTSSGAQYILTLDEAWDVANSEAPITYTLVNPALLRTVTVRRGQKLNLRQWQWLVGETD